jgi:hypothetical protein
MSWTSIHQGYLELLGCCVSPTLSISTACRCGTFAQSLFVRNFNQVQAAFSKAKGWRNKHPKLHKVRIMVCTYCTTLNIRYVKICWRTRNNIPCQRLLRFAPVGGSSSSWFSYLVEGSMDGIHHRAFRPLSTSIGWIQVAWTPCVHDKLPNLLAVTST